MKTRILKLNVLLLTITLLIFASCEGLLESENLEEGIFTFWSNFDGPPIDIFVDNTYYGSINTFYSSNPGCEADGCVTLVLAPGYTILKPLSKLEIPEHLKNGMGPLKLRQMYAACWDYLPDDPGIGIVVKL